MLSSLATLDNILSDVRAIAFCFLVKTNAADPRSGLIDLEAIVLSLSLQVLHCRADAVAKLEYSSRVLNSPEYP